MQHRIQGTFHFHSSYSHDGRSTLSEIAAELGRRGLSFCVMTEHFEDFDPVKFNSYLWEVRDVTEKSGFLLIPGVEINLSGLDTILFPASDYSRIVSFVTTGKDSDPPLCKVLAHASKYPFEKGVEHVEKYAIRNIELWNQQADGSHMPPFKLLRMWETYSRRKQYRYFFGCDLHNVNLTVANVLSLPASSEPTAQAIIQNLTHGDFICRNLPTGIEYRNGSESIDFDTWLRSLQKNSYYRGRLLGSVRSGLKSAYRVLPRDVQRSLNDVKNFVRNKV